MKNAKKSFNACDETREWILFDNFYDCQVCVRVRCACAVRVYN